MSTKTEVVGGPWRTWLCSNSSFLRKLGSGRPSSRLVVGMCLLSVVVTVALSPTLFDVASKALRRPTTTRDDGRMVTTHLSTSLTSELFHPPLAQLSFQTTIVNRIAGRSWLNRNLYDVSLSPSPPETQRTILGRTLGQGGCGGRCWGPGAHPGQFTWWYGQANGCWVQLWRQWPDGCTHYQLFNTCGNYFDPQIHWTCCVH